jgi:hypothetical protein
VRRRSERARLQLAVPPMWADGLKLLAIAAASFGFVAVLNQAKADTAAVRAARPRGARLCADAAGTPRPRLTAAQLELPTCRPSQCPRAPVPAISIHDTRPRLHMLLVPSRKYMLALSTEQRHD